MKPAPLPRQQLLHRQQRQPLLGDRPAELGELDAVLGELRQQTLAGRAGVALEALEQSLRLEVGHIHRPGIVSSYTECMAGHGQELPIFELPVVLLPGELMPLHIFEERYKRMINRCVEAEEPFGIVFRDDDGGARRIGCEARVTEVTERFDDGRLNIIVTGERPFRVLDRFEAPEYPAGEVEPMEAPDDDPATSDHAADAREAFAELVRRVGGDPPETAELESYDSYGIAARVELPAETKQRLLELRSEPERMRVLAAALGVLVDAVARSREIAERAKVNGKVIVGDL